MKKIDVKKMEEKNIKKRLDKWQFIVYNKDNKTRKR